MKIKGQHGEFGRLPSGEPIPKRQIEIGEDERLELQLVRRLDGNPVREMVIDFFMPGVLTVEWEQGATLEVEGVTQKRKRIGKRT